MPILMSSLFALSAFAQMSSSYKIDFREEMDEPWTVVVDGVMGGRSSGKITLEDDHLLFSGEVSLANNGGFSSMRAPWKAYDLSLYSTVTLRSRATGQSFYLTMQHHAEWYRPGHRLHYKKSDEWVTVTYPLADLQETRIGEATGQSIDADVLSQIKRMGIITGDKKACEFVIELDYIEFQ